MQGPAVIRSQSPQLISDCRASTYYVACVSYPVVGAPDRQRALARPALGRRGHALALHRQGHADQRPLDRHRLREDIGRVGDPHFCPEQLQSKAFLFLIETDTFLNRNDRGGRPMKRHKFIVPVIAAYGLVLVLPGTAWCQSLKDQLLGNWELVSISEDYGNGKINKAPFGTSLKGSYDFDGNGRVMFTAIGDDLPPNPARKPQESARLVVAWFGTYAVDDAAKTYTYTAERSTIPAFDGKPRTVAVTIAGDEMTIKPAPVTGPEGTFTPILLLKRAH
jgi:Lipocalin-like domain